MDETLFGRRRSSRTSLNVPDRQSSSLPTTTPLNYAKQQPLHEQPERNTKADRRLPPRAAQKVLKELGPIHLKQCATFPISIRHSDCIVSPLLLSQMPLSLVPDAFVSLVAICIVEQLPLPSR